MFIIYNNLGGNMKRILHILSSNKYSGAENLAATIIKNLDSEYESAYVSPDGPIRDSLEERGVTYLPIKNNSVSNIKRIIRDWKPDLIHAHDFTASIRSALATSKIPVISHIHQNPMWLKRLNPRSFLFSIACFRLSHIIAVTPAIIDSAFFSPLFKKKFSVLENIVDTKLLVNKANMPYSNKYDLVFIGRLVDVKNPLRFINIIEKLKENNQNIKAVIVGDGPLREECQRVIKEKDLEKNIFLKGHMSNPYPVLRNSKLLVMTSKSEGLPMTVIEGLILGKPVIVPQIEGIGKFVSREYGLVCKDDQDYFEGITKLLTDKETYLNMSETARENAKSMFNLENYCRKLDEVYKGVI